MVYQGENDTRFSVFVVGLTSLITQVILIRMFLAVFGGNELIIGVVLSNWMFLTALGAYTGRYFDRNNNIKRLFFFAHLLTGILPIATGFLIFYLRNIIFPPGKIVDLLEIFTGSMLLLLPYCFTSGVLFTLFSSYLSKQFSSNKINNVYALDLIGSIVGGLLFNFIFIFIFTPFFSLKLLLVLNFLAAILFSFRVFEMIFIKIIGLTAIAVTGIIMILNINEKAWEEMYPNQNILTHTNTPYGNIVITESSGQYNFYQNGMLLFSNNNTIANEENVHYAMLQHPDPENVLLVSGGLSGILNEILKYNVKTIDYLEIDPALVKLTGNYLQNSRRNKKVNIINQDARQYLKKINKEYDIVLINLPDPITIQLNRYFTLEFFEELKTKLSKNAIVSIGLNSSVNYLSSEAKQTHIALYSSLKLIFENVIIIPGMKNYFLASDGLLSSDIGKLAKLKNVTNKYVNSYYLDDELINERKQKIESIVKQDVIINYDYFPVTFLFQLNLWMNKTNFNLVFAILLLLIIFTAIVPRLNIVNFGLFSTGFSAISIEILLIIAFQIIYGYVFFMLGIFITVFMIGLLFGSVYLHRRVIISMKNYSLIQYILGIFAVLTPIILIGLKSNQLMSFLVHAIFILLILIAGSLTGLQFSMGAVLRKAGIAKSASGAYGSDLLGAAVGALLLTTLLIPYFGIIKVCLIIGILNFLTGLLILFKSANR